jgi:hypothetical protein
VSNVRYIRYVRGGAITDVIRQSPWVSTGSEARDNYSAVDVTRGVGNPWNRRISVITTVILIIFVSFMFEIAITSTSIVPSTLVTLPTNNGSQPLPYPIGIPSSAEASGLAPPGPVALTGYEMTYTTNFPGSAVPAGWIVYHGVPMNDVGAQFGSAHVVVHGGMLQLNTWRDPQYQNRWVTGGLCQCGAPQRYGAFFVRSRLTGGGASAVQLLWPSSNQWPPEVDFNETGGSIKSTSETVHFGPTNQIFQSVLRIDMLKWHTWGVIWTPTTITYSVDGLEWSSVSNSDAGIPNVPMHLVLQQQTWCNQGRICPSAPVSMLVNWIAEYRTK